MSCSGCGKELASFVLIPPLLLLCFTSLSLPDGWSILLQHPVPVSFRPPWSPWDEPWWDGHFQAWTATFHCRLVSLSPCAGSEDAPTWRLPRWTAGAQTALPFRGQWRQSRTCAFICHERHEWVSNINTFVLFDFDSLCQFFQLKTSH